jgi:hypothetical protein
MIEEFKDWEVKEFVSADRQERAERFDFQSPFMERSDRLSARLLGGCHCLIYASSRMMHSISPS